MKKMSVSVFIFMCVFDLCQSARILAMMPAPFYSHQAYFFPLWRNLSQRGHHITIYSTHFINDESLTNITEIDISTKISNYNYTKMFQDASESWSGVAFLSWFSYYKVFDILLEDEPLNSLLNNKEESFDLLMVDSKALPLYAFAKKFNCPIISISSLICSMFSYKSIGNMEAFNNVEDTFSKQKLNLIQELHQSLSKYFGMLLEYFYLTYTSKVIQKHFGSDYSIEELFSRVSLIFENTNNILHPVRPIVPTLIQVDGLNLFHNHPSISKDLQYVLDNAKNGFIYVSLGTILESQPNSEVFLETFKKLPYTVLWKNDNENLWDPFNNVYVSKWFPQFNILRHKNIKLFILQGGYHSMLEAIHNQVPMIAMPVYLDQFTNSEKIMNFGVGLRLDFENLNKEQFKSAVKDVAENSTYKTNIVKLSKIVKDQPLHGLEKAVYWTEHAIRHNGAIHFRSPVLDVPFYQYYLLDVIAIALIVLVSFAYLTKVIVITVINTLFKRTKKEKVKKA